MILNIDQIKTITKGALSICEIDGFYSFSRFTQCQLDVYKKNSDFYMKTKATAGVRFAFVTDSDKFSFEYIAKRGSSRNFCYFDIYINGLLSYHIGEDMINDDIKYVNIALPSGINEIVVYFPCLANVLLRNISLEKDAFIHSKDYNERFVFYGDSITQGYDSYFPSLVYAMRVADELGADCLNQGIGAEVFDQDTLDAMIPYEPTKVFVAYGTNDWSHGRVSIYAEAEAYIKKIMDIHKGRSIYLITPIYRLDDMTVEKSIGNFYEMSNTLMNIASKYDINIIKGTDISVPSSKAFSDNWLHPNEIGFDFMAKGIIKAVKHLESIKNL